MQQNNFIANLFSAQHVSGTIMPITRSSRLYRWLRHVVHNTVKMEHINYKLDGGGVFVGIMLPCVGRVFYGYVQSVMNVVGVVCGRHEWHNVPQPSV
jgi:hypothetical protein